MQLWPVDWPLSVRKQCRKASCRNNRQKARKHSAGQYRAIYVLVCIGPEPCPPDQSADRAAAEQRVGGKQSNCGIHREPAMYKTIYEIKDARIEKIQGVLQ